MRKKWFMVPVGIAAMALFIFVGGWVVMHLWNWLLPVLFGWRVVTFWQALGILLLCRILFGGIGHGHRRFGRPSRVRDRWNSMTAEERERFRQGMHGRCGFGPPATESKQS